MSADIHNDPCDERASNTGSSKVGRVGAGETRQQRVGILRNTNRASPPLPRRAQLTGKWLSLRSSRRAAPSMVEVATQMVQTDKGLLVAWAEEGARQPVPETASPGRGEASGRVEPVCSAELQGHANAAPDAPVTRIDIARLTKAVADRGTKKSCRRRYGEAVSPTCTPLADPSAEKRAPTNLSDSGADDDLRHLAATRRASDSKKDGLPPLADAGDDASRHVEAELSAPVGKGAGARVLRGLLVLGMAGLAIAAIFLLPRV